MQLLVTCQLCALATRASMGIPAAAVDAGVRRHTDDDVTDKAVSDNIVILRCRRMNRVAMALDDSLAARSATTAATERGMRDGDAGGGGSAAAVIGWAMSPSARFQTLLVHARQRECLQGYYEAMLERCVFWVLP